MKILAINTERTWRGGERQTLYCAEGLSALGVEVELLCRSGHPLAERAAAMDMVVHTVASQPAAIRFLLSRGREFDLLHAQTAKGQSLAVLSKPVHGRPIVYTRRVDFVPRGLPTKIKYARTDRVVAISGAIQDILQGFGVRSVAVIPSAAKEAELDKDRAERLRKEHGLAEKKILGTTGSLVPHKDPLTMARAMRALRDLRGDDFVFLHFGDGELRPALEAEVQRLGLGNNYRLMGFTKEIIPWFGVLDAFVMSSRQEGLGSSALDAFLYGVPVASTDAGGLKECVEGHGLVSPAEDPGRLAENIHRLLEEPHLGQELAAKASVYVREHHSVEGTAKTYLELFKTLAE